MKLSSRMQVNWGSMGVRELSPGTIPEGRRVPEWCTGMETRGPPGYISCMITPAGSVGDKNNKVY